MATSDAQRTVAITIVWQQLFRDSKFLIAIAAIKGCSVLWITQ
jgi:hypothetical protein